MGVSIRIAKKGDAKGVAAFWNDALRNGHLKYTGNNRRRGKADIKRFDAGYSKRKGSFSFVAINKEGRIIGVSSFESKKYGRTRHRGEVGWTVHQDYSGKGIGTRLVKAVLREAKRRGFKKIEAEAAIENIASERLARKLGFKIEGRKKAGLVLDDGRYVDTYVFGKILR
jgi:RimJ/RimL family protein N-acetyltransferase